jgi:hypothetical protein
MVAIQFHDRSTSVAEMENCSSFSSITVITSTRRCVKNYLRFSVRSPREIVSSLIGQLRSSGPDLKRRLLEIPASGQGRTLDQCGNDSEDAVAANRHASWVSAMREFRVSHSRFVLRHPRRAMRSTGDTGCFVAAYSPCRRAGDGTVQGTPIRDGFNRLPPSAPVARKHRGPIALRSFSPWSSDSALENTPLLLEVCTNWPMRPRNRPAIPPRSTESERNPSLRPFGKLRAGSAQGRLALGMTPWGLGMRSSGLGTKSGGATPRPDTRYAFPNLSIAYSPLPVSALAPRSSFRLGTITYLSRSGSSPRDHARSYFGY